MNTGLGPLGRLGLWTAHRFRWVALSWLALALALGALAPGVEKALSGAGWEATGSESAEARGQIDRSFAGAGSYGLMAVVHAPDLTFGDTRFREVVDAVEERLAASDEVSAVTSPRPGQTISADGRTVIVQAGAAGDPNEMVAAADRLKGPLAELGGDDVQVHLTGASGMWADFNHANKTAMMKSELISWPVTLAILVVAFGSLVAAGLPLMLTITGLIAAAGSLFLAGQILPVSIWAMNFALMFALALGIDYALFIVYRFRGALFGSGLPPDQAVAETMDTAGKAVLFSGVTVLISLSAVMLVPSPAFRSMSLGIMLSVIFVLAASLTLLPAVLAKLGPRIDRLALPWVHTGEHRSTRFERWGRRLWRRPWGYLALATLPLLVLALPVFSLETGMPSIKVVPEEDGSRLGYEQVQASFGPGATGPLQVVSPAGESAAVREVLGDEPAVAAVLPTVEGGEDLALTQVFPATDPSDAATAALIDRLREALPESARVGGAVAEYRDLELALGRVTPIVIGMVLALGFLLLLVALRAPLIAAVGVLVNLLAAGAAFGVAKLIFQDGHLAGPLGFESQGFLDAWGPVFFFAMIFAISMDYTVFLLSSAKEHWERSGSAEDAMVGGLAHSGRVIIAAAAVMVAVFFTFALSGPLPPKEMGVILGVAVLLDAVLVRLILLPVAMRLLGPWAWYLPSPLGRLLPDIRFGHS